MEAEAFALACLPVQEEPAFVELAPLDLRTVVEHRPLASREVERNDLLAGDLVPVRRLTDEVREVEHASQVPSEWEGPARLVARNARGRQRNVSQLGRAGRQKPEPLTRF